MIAYSVGTWDAEKSAYTPQLGLTKWHQLTRAELKVAIQELQCMGYSAHRRGNTDSGHEDNDWTVLIERTDEMTEADVLKSWER